MHNVLQKKKKISLRFVNSVDCSAESFYLQVDMIYCGTVQAVSLSASPSRLVTLLSSSRAKHLNELMAILAK